jgi:catechol 2,3-dioxygenase-like lactoylglutathione lyase family enzyme
MEDSYMASTRRDITLGLASVVTGLATSAGAAPAVEAQPRNPLGVRLKMYTVVATDLERSNWFYTEMLGYTAIKKGAVGGRNYVLLSFGEATGGLIRLLAAPSGAKPNRPTPGARPWDRGFGAIENSTRDIEESYQLLTRAGIKTLSPPVYYFFRDMQRLNGSTMYPKLLDTLTYVPIGPAGELIYISIVLPDNFGRKFDRLHTECHNSFVVHSDRRPVWAFYEKALGIIPISQYQGTLSSQQAVNRLLGEEADAWLWAGGMGDSFGMEWMEWQAPAGITPAYFPQSLERSGHAMLTVSVNDLGAVRKRLKTAGILSEAEKALPLPDVDKAEALRIRGACGELIEIVDHSVL